MELVFTWKQQVTFAEAILSREREHQGVNQRTIEIVVVQYRDQALTTVMGVVGTIQRRKARKLLITSHTRNRKRKI